MASRADSTRLENDEDERWGRAAPGPPAGIPLGAILLLASLALVFAYGIYLKSAGAPTIVAAGSGTTSRAARSPASTSTFPGARPAPGRTTPGHDAASPAPDGARDKPLLPDRPGPAPAVHPIGRPAGASDSDSSQNSQASPASPRAGEPADAPEKAQPGADGAASPPEPDAVIPRSRTVTGAPDPVATNPPVVKAPPQPPAGSRAGVHVLPVFTPGPIGGGGDEYVDAVVERERALTGRSARAGASPFRKIRGGRPILGRMGPIGSYRLLDRSDRRAPSGSARDRSLPYRRPGTQRPVRASTGVTRFVADLCRGLRLARGRPQGRRLDGPSSRIQREAFPKVPRFARENPLGPFFVRGARGARVRNWWSRRGGPNLLDGQGPA